MAEHAIIRQGSLHWQLQIKRGVPWEVNDYLLFAVRSRDKAASLFPGCGADRACGLIASSNLLFRCPLLLYYSRCNWFGKGLGESPHEQAYFSFFLFFKEATQVLML